MDEPNQLLLSGHLKITESNAILRHIARKNGLDGNTEEDKVKVDMLEALTYNFHIDFARICYSPDYVSPCQSPMSWLSWLAY